MKESDRNPPSEEVASEEIANHLNRLRKGLPTIIGLGLVGLAVGVAALLFTRPFQSVTTTARVVFSFPGFEKGQYPDGSKFQPDDLRSPDVIAEALKRKGLDATEEVQSKVRSALTIEGIIPDSVVKERDKQRANGQPPRPYLPDEYAITLTLSPRFPLSARERELLISEIVSVAQEKFVRTYVALPLDFGKAFQALAGADYFDYGLVLNRESQNLEAFLTQMSNSGRAFRSPHTNQSFSDLLKQAQLFKEIDLNEVLGLIRRDGLSKDRRLAMVKMDYYLKTLNDEESRAIEEEKVVLGLLKQAQEREQGYTLGIKSQATQPRNENVVVDQGLVDSLLANDSYNFLVRKALDASLNTRRIQAEKAVLQERIQSMEAFLKSDTVEKANSLGQFEKSLENLRKTYDTLIANIRQTYQDYQQQQYGDAIRISMQARTASVYKALAFAGAAGLAVGIAFGCGLVLLGLGLGAKHAR